jgi:hypothetical protein
MPDHLKELWRFAPVVAILLLAFWAGHRGWWFWGPGVRVVMAQLERERDEWRKLARALLRKQGIEWPEDAPPTAASAFREQIEKGK